MSYFVRGSKNATSQAWVVQFLEPDLKTSAGRTFTYDTADKVTAIFEQSQSRKTTEFRQALDVGIELGRGGIYLELSDEQYQKLRASRP